MNCTLEFETDDRAVEITFLVDNVDGENEWSVDYNYIEVSEDGGPRIPRTWAYLMTVYDLATLMRARDEAIAWAVDNYKPDEDHTLDDEGD